MHFNDRVRFQYVYMRTIISSLYCRAVNITDNFYTKQEKSSIFGNNIGGLPWGMYCSGPWTTRALTIHGFRLKQNFDNFIVQFLPGPKIQVKTDCFQLSFPKISSLQAVCPCCIMDPLRVDFHFLGYVCTWGHWKTTMLTSLWESRLHLIPQ